MNAAKKIRKLIENNQEPEQITILKSLVLAIEKGEPFQLQSLYDLNMPHFDLAIELIQDWRFDHHISSRSKLWEQLANELRARPDDEPAQAVAAVNGVAPAVEEVAAPVVEKAPAKTPAAPAAKKPAAKRTSKRPAAK
ncbi:MAG: hypothetical protein ACN6N0_09090 [Microvirgula sp.]